jgi:hypothetical protein
MRTRILAACYLALVFCGLAGFYRYGLNLEPPSPPQATPQAPVKGEEESAAEKREADARRQLAFVSLQERLPKGKPIPPRKPLGTDARNRWELLDEKLAKAQHRRAVLLKAFHEKTTKFFVDSPGAGSWRGGPTPGNILMDNWRSDGGNDQPGLPADFPDSPGEQLLRVRKTDRFDSLHGDAMVDFLWPIGFGLARDRARVAGFKSHGFRSTILNYPNPVRDHRVPQDNERWRVSHIQLVGILVHEQPIVYLTDKLPSMEQVRQGKTRTLDFFEEAALPALRDGEDLYIVRKNDTLRMLGALRATKTCQQCHDAEIGDLLGVFSYTLRLDPKQKN